MISYRVTVDLGALSWDISHGDGALDDADEILDNLSFSWSMPEGLWPTQPNPMTATLGINVPDFTSGVSDLVEGDPCAIQFYFTDDDGLHETLTASFYGRITDLQANPRSRRDGVTLSVVAVDYTVDMAELDPWAPAPGTWTAPTLLEQLWDDRITSDFPTWDTSLGLMSIDPQLDDRPPSEVIAFELVQNIGTTLGEPTHRAILAPNIDFSTGTLDTTQEWAFDMIYKDSPEDPYTIPCDRVEKESLTWLYSKQTGPNAVFVVGPEGYGTGSAAHPGITHRRLETIDATITDSLDPVAEFYLPDPTPSGWRVDTFRFHTTRGAGIHIDDVPAMLFPSWTLSPGSPDRSSCYGHPIILSDVPWHVNPLASGPTPETSDVTGRLTGASFTVAGGHVFLDLQLRQTGLAA